MNYEMKCAVDVGVSLMAHFVERQFPIILEFVYRNCLEINIARTSGMRVFGLQHQRS